MRTPDPQILIHQANLSYNYASNELNKAKEDLITHVICHQSRNSIRDYLMGYIVANKVDLPNPATIENMAEVCKNIDPVFHKLDLSPIQCKMKTLDEDYCLDIKTVGACYKVAGDVKKMVTSDMD